MADKLKPCPFCGEAVIFRKPNVVGESGYIEHIYLSRPCRYWSFSALIDEENDDVIAAWNRRTEAQC